MSGVDVISVISTVGFPIAMCLVMMWYVKDLNESHKTETKYMTEALNKNTLAIQKLCAKLNINVEEEE